MPATTVRKILRNLGLLFVAAQLVAFATPQSGDLIELKDEMRKLLLNARSSQHFRSIDNNVTYQLKAGTRALVKKVQKFQNGNSGVCLEIKNSDDFKADQDCVWVYYRRGNPNMKLYSYSKNPQERDAKLAEWAKQGKKVSLQKVKDPTHAQAAETTKPVTAIASSKKPASDSTASVKPSSKQPDAEAVIQLIADSQSPSAQISNSCSDCDTAALAATEIQIKSSGARKMAQRCSMLMSQSGKLGSGGRTLVSIMSEPKYEKHYTKSNALGSYCPKFNSLSKNQKLMAWAWFWTALAQEEASCRVDAHHGTSYTRNGKSYILNPREGYGLWALERDPNVRSWRGSSCKSVTSVEGQARCSIDIMMKHQLSKGIGASGKIGYWGPVKREYKDHQLMPHMKRFNLCF